jgi:HopA1 effector protein family
LLADRVRNYLYDLYFTGSLVPIDTIDPISPKSSERVENAQFVRIYFNITPDAAVAIAAQLTIVLNKLGIRFEFAILHHPHLFHLCFVSLFTWDTPTSASRKSVLARQAD